MEVVFKSKSRNSSRIGPMVLGKGEGQKKVTIDNGRLTTTDKEEIKQLMAHPFYQRGHFHLDTDAKLVNDYLANDEEPDYIDEDYLEKISPDAILKLGKVCNCRNQFPELVKNELRNEPITDDIAEIVKQDLDGSEDEDSEAESKNKAGSGKKKTKKKAKKKTKKKKSS